MTPALPSPPTPEQSLLNPLIPGFDWHTVVVRPWTDSFSFSLWVVLMGFFTTAACGLIGNYLLLRRMALVGDAISHSILPGLVLAFILFQSGATWVMFLGALAAALLTVLLIEFIHTQSRLKPDAAICIAFTALFALGVMLLTSLEGHGALHLDADCVLYGEIAFAPLEPPLLLLGHEIGPPSVLRMGAVLAVLILLIALFYKELLLTSFDPGLAASLGFNTALWHYGLMAALAIVVVSAFEAVGAILVVAMLVVPPMFAGQLSSSLPARMAWTLLHAALSSLLGWHLSLWLNCSTAGAMVVTGALLFCIVWAGSLAIHALHRQAAASTPATAPHAQQN